MSLMISVSGIRGIVGESLTPKNLTAFAMAFASLILRQKEGSGGEPIRKNGRKSSSAGIPARQARLSEILSAIHWCFADVMLLILVVATTPTVEIAVPGEHADGGLIITASHNPVAWNALKMLNHRGEFLSSPRG